ncbi:hypothetical protein J437_LFUL014863 [Ladona fulva]|uniref:Uncharacterized protein n=1 Tax=Ladona fulva TaxID=123851 RepID=A0A8K0KHI3_LADFU|nr:hypothetical protein J437_LFUL014863 [Ladona fulva]
MQENSERAQNVGYQQQPSPSEEDRNVNDNSNPGVVTETISSNDAVRASRKKSHLYAWLTILAGIFYFVPAVQRVFTHLFILQETGDYDLCYYNYHCAHPLLIFMDFNHVYSNIGYILLGLLFIGITISENKWYKKQNSNRQDPGVPHEFGLYYAMGVSLLIEGFLSATYHICPRGSNFQFVNVINWLLAALGISGKLGGVANIVLITFLANLSAFLLYHICIKNRHQHIYANATSIFMLLGCVTFFVMLGTILSQFYLSIAIAIGQIVASLVITLQLYYYGKISKGGSNKLL